MTELEEIKIRFKECCYNKDGSSDGLIDFAHWFEVRFLNDYERSQGKVVKKKLNEE